MPRPDRFKKSSIRSGLYLHLRSAQIVIVPKTQVHQPIEIDSDLEIGDIPIYRFLRGRRFQTLRATHSKIRYRALSYITKTIIAQKP